jgi:nicotinamidase-related amidase
MDALLLIDAAADRFPAAPPQPLLDLVARVRGAGGVIVHVAQAAQDTGQATQDSAEAAAGSDDAVAPPRIDSVVGTREDELVLVSAVPDAFEGVEDLAEGLDDLGVDRIILAGSNVRGGLEQSGYAALAIGFELVVVRDGLGEGTADGEGAADPAAASGADWPAQLEAAGAVLTAGADVWLTM